MNEAIFKQPVQATLESLRQPSIADAQRLVGIKISGIAFALLALLVVAFESKIIYATFEMTFGTEDKVWKPWIMAFASLILVLAVHFIGQKNADHPVLQFVNRATALLIPIYLVGIGVLIVVTLYNGGLGEMLSSFDDDISLDALLAEESDSVLDKMMTSILTPLAGSLFSIGIGSLAIVSVFVAHFALSQFEKRFEEYSRLSQAVELDERDVSAYQAAKAEYESLQAQIDNLLLYDDEIIREALADEVLLSIQDALEPTIKLINHNKYTHREADLLPPNQIDISALEKAIKPIQSINREDILKHLV